MVRVAICENVGADLTRLKNLLKSSGALLDITEYTSGEPLLWDIRTGRIYFDIFFVGNQINELNGAEISKRIRLMDEDSIVIFLQDSEKAVQETHQPAVFAVLTKPLNQVLFERVFTRAIEKASRDRAQVLTVSHHTHSFTVRHTNINYIENQRRKILIHLHPAETRQYGGRFSDFITLLSNEQFVRCHRNYIVNLNRVTELTSTGFKLGDAFIPISRPYRAIVRERYNKHLFAVFDQE